ncbi:MAG: hypothetical protein ACK4OM_06005 [Alphaproteobacteria bacterium]
MTDISINSTKITPKHDLNKIKETAAEYKSVFLSKMLNIVFENVNFNPLAPKDSKSEIFKSMLVDEYGKAISKSSTFNLDEHITRKLMQLQEVTND